MNSVNLVGNLTRDPEIRDTASGAAVCNFGLAMNRRWNDRQTGERREEATFVDLEAWGKTAEVVSRYCSKGQQLAVEGRLKLDEWQDNKTGERRTKLKVVAEKVHLISKSPKGDSNIPF